MLPRAVQIIGGIAIAAYSVLTMACGVSMFLWSGSEHPLALVGFGVVIEAGALWTFVKGADLLFGRRTQGGLISASALRCIAGAYAFVMIMALAIAPSSQSLLARAAAVVGVTCVIGGLFAVARRRQAVKKIEDSRRFEA